MGAGTLACGEGLVGQLVTAWGQPGSRGLSLELGLDWLWVGCTSTPVRDQRMSLYVHSNSCELKDGFRIAFSVREK